jgi:hypothetical protein
MLEEALKWVGPHPLVQLFGSLLLLWLGYKSAVAGKAATVEPRSAPVEVDLPDWFIREVRDHNQEQRDLLKRALYLLEDIRNQGE